jgi:glutamate synthase (NADPH/NADH) large chain
VIDEDGSFSGHFNDAIADLLNVVPESEDDAELKEMIENHVTYTGSTLGSKLLADWSNSITKFKKIFPRDYARVLRGGAAALSDANGDSTGPKEEVGSRG